MRTVWRGSIGFGLVNVPVRLYTAVRSHSVRFRQLHGATGAPVQQRRVDAQTGEEVAYEDIVKGYEIGEGRYLVVDPDELDELQPGASRLIDIRDYVEQGEIDPVHYDRPYYLAPDGEIAVKAYRLLAEAMERAGKVAIASFVMRNREYLAAIRARDGLLVLSTMHYADEVADPAELDVDLGTGGEVSEREVAMAQELIGALLTRFDPTAYRDEYHDRLLALLEAKAQGETIEVSEPRRPEGNVVDLVAALEQSLGRTRETEGAADGGPGRAGAAADAYERMTRDELYELARERELPGRSNPSKRELAAALRAEDRETGAA